MFLHPCNLLRAYKSGSIKCTARPMIINALGRILVAFAMRVRSWIDVLWTFGHPMMQGGS